MGKKENPVHTTHSVRIDHYDPETKKFHIAREDRPVTTYPSGKTSIGFGPTQQDVLVISFHQLMTLVQDAYEQVAYDLNLMWEAGVRIDPRTESVILPASEG